MVPLHWKKKFIFNVKMFITPRNFILRTGHLKFILGTQNGSSMALV